MTKTIAHTYTLAHGYRRQITLVAMAFCMIMALGYVINLYKVISHTVALQHVNSEAAALSGEIQTLDAKYLGLSGTLTPDILHKYGLNKGEVSAFISRRASLGRVDLIAHEL